MKRYSLKNKGDHYEIVDTKLDVVCDVVFDHTAAYGIVRDLNTVEFKKAPNHHAFTSVSRTGGKTWGHPGNPRESEAHCTCGWSETENGQTYAESIQEIKEHLKEMDVYTTPLEQAVYAHITPANVLVTQIAAGSCKSLGRVQKALDKFVARGNVEEFAAGLYRRTDKYFSWND